MYINRAIVDYRTVLDSDNWNNPLSCLLGITVDENTTYREFWDSVVPEWVAGDNTTPPWCSDPDRYIDDLLHQSVEEIKERDKRTLDQKVWADLTESQRKEREVYVVVTLAQQ